MFPRQVFKGRNMKVLDISAAMQGTLIFSQPVHIKINGSFQGDLVTKGVLEIGKGARVTARIQGEIVKVSGYVKGDIQALKTLVVTSTGRIIGNMRTPNLNVENGALIKGNCDMPLEREIVEELKREDSSYAGLAEGARSDVLTHEDVSEFLQR